MPDLDSLLTELASVVSRCADAAGVHAASAVDEQLLHYQREVAASARLLDVTAAAIAAEISHRSRRELGYQGLAQRHGARTPEALVQSITGTSASAARRLVRVGTLVAEQATSEADPLFVLPEPWLQTAVRAARAGEISGEALQAIRGGLGAPSSTPSLGAVSVGMLAQAVEILTAEASTATPEQLAATRENFAIAWMPRGSVRAKRNVATAATCVCFHSLTG